MSWGKANEEREHKLLYKIKMLALGTLAYILSVECLTINKGTHIVDHSEDIETRRTPSGLAPTSLIWLLTFFSIPAICY